MDKKRSLSMAFLCGLISAPAFAQLTTIGPSTPGVEEFQMTLVPTSTLNFFLPKFTPVPLGSLPGGNDSFYPDVAVYDPRGCLEGCFALPENYPQQFVMFGVTFSKPVSTVSVLQMGYSFDFGNGAEVLAYNSSQQNVGGCIVAFGYSPSQPPGCFNLTSSDNFGDFFGNL